MSRRARRCALVGVAVALWCAPGALARATTNARTTADEPQYLLSAISLAEDRSLDIADERRAGRYRAFHEIGLPLQEEIRPDGSRVSPHDPLLPALLALPVALGGWLGAKLALALAAGTLAAVLVWLAEARFAVAPAVAVAVVGGFATAAPLAIYATQVYPEIAGALVVALLLALVTGPMSRARDAVTFVALVSCLPWLSVKYAPIAVALGAAGAVRARPGTARRLLVALAGASALGFAWLHVRWYGGLTPYAAGAHFTSGELGVVGGRPDFVGRSTRLTGLLVDRNFGLAAWQPATLLALPALGAFVRRRPAGWLPVTTVLATGWLTATFVALTMHGWWFPGRQVVVVLPCIVLIVAWWSTAVAERARRALVRCIVACGALGASLYLWFVAQALTTELRIVTTFGDVADPWWRLAGALLPDLRADRPLDTARLVAWSAAALAAIALGARGARGARGAASDPRTTATDRQRPRALVTA